MERLIVAFDGQNTLSRMCEIVESGGYRIAAACMTCSEVLRRVSNQEDLIVFCGFKLRDGPCEELFSNLPEGIPMLMLAGAGDLNQVENEAIIKLRAPVKRSELLDSIGMLAAMRRPHEPKQPRPRSEADRAIIEQAKALLMERHGMTEAQAHHMIQKRSMDTGIKMVETAKLVLGERSAC